MKKLLTPSGFPENLPQEQILENQFKNIFSSVCESYGYVPLETPAIEYLETLSSKGDINKEIYTITRALGESDSEEKQKRALRFDLTVPLARYVGQHYTDLLFPFKRYQIQKVWRGERAQKGRFREFYQADIDVIANAKLPLHFDAEVALIVAQIFSNFPIHKDIVIHINNRKFLNGLLKDHGVDDFDFALKTIDKIDKIGQAEVRVLMLDKLSVKEEAVDSFLKKISKNYPLKEAKIWLETITTQDEEYKEGILELLTVFDYLKDFLPKKGVTFIFSPKIARGLDYYTGTVYETFITGLEKYGSVCSGGRYANLSERFINRKLPGVGLSIGLSRLLDIIKNESLVSYPPPTTSTLLIGFNKEEERGKVNALAYKFRELGIHTETIHDASFSFGKQKDYANKKKVAFLFLEEGNFSFFIDSKRENFNTEQSMFEYIKNERALY